MRRFTIAADRIGPRRWCRVRIHESVEDLRQSARRTSPWTPASDWAETLGCFQPNPICIDAATGEVKESSYAGILRLADGWVTAEIVAHELVHAALQVYRMNVSPNVRLGNGCREREEQLAYIYGALYASFEAKFHE